MDPTHGENDEDEKSFLKKEMGSDDELLGMPTTKRSKQVIKWVFLLNNSYL